jgi:hypothetical protein
VFHISCLIRFEKMVCHLIKKVLVIHGTGMPSTPNLFTLKEGVLRMQIQFIAFLTLPRSVTAKAKNNPGNEPASLGSVTVMQKSLFFLRSRGC